MKKTLVIFIVAIMLVGFFQEELISIYVHYSLTKQTSKISFIWDETNILGKTSPVALGEISKCGNVFKVKLPKDFKIYSNREGYCILEHANQKKSTIMITSGNETWNNNIFILKNFFEKTKKMDKKSFVTELYPEINKTNNLFDKQKIIFKKLEEGVDVFNLVDNTAAFALAYAAPIFLIKSKVEYQRIDGHVIMKIENKKTKKYFLFLPNNDVVHLDFSGEDESSDFPESYIKALVTPNSIVIDHKAEEKASAEIDIEIKKMKENFERTGKIK